jgi:hypothetical protein
MILVCAALAALASCAREPDAYPPPLQRSIAGFVPGRPPDDPFLDMTDRDGDVHMVSGIMLGPAQGKGWRWAYEHVELQYLLDKAEGWKFTMDLALPEPNFKQTGPLTITLKINGQVLAATRYAAPGDYHFERPVPAEWLLTSGFNCVTLDTNPPWVAPDDGARLGFLLFRAGFVAK